jgi:hypothetical protein
MIYTPSPIFLLEGGVEKNKILPRTREIPDDK